MKDSTLKICLLIFMLGALDALASHRDIHCWRHLAPPETPLERDLRKLMTSPGRRLRPNFSFLHGLDAKWSKEFAAMDAEMNGKDAWSASEYEAISEMREAAGYGAVIATVGPFNTRVGVLIYRTSGANTEILRVVSSWKDLTEADGLLITDHERPGLRDHTIITLLNLTREMMFNECLSTSLHARVAEDRIHMLQLLREADYRWVHTLPSASISGPNRFLLVLPAPILPKIRPALSFIRNRALVDEMKRGYYFPSANTETFYTEEQLDLLRSVNNIDRFGTVIIYPGAGLVGFMVLDKEHVDVKTKTDLHVRTLVTHPAFPQNSLMEMLSEQLLTFAHKNDARAIIISAAEPGMHERLTRSRYDLAIYEPVIGYYQEPNSPAFQFFANPMKLPYGGRPSTTPMPIFRVLPGDPIVSSLSGMAGDNVAALVNDGSNVFVVATDERRRPIALLWAEVIDGKTLSLKMTAVSQHHSQPERVKGSLFKYLMTGSAEKMGFATSGRNKIAKVLIPKDETTYASLMSALSVRDAEEEGDAVAFALNVTAAETLSVGGVVTYEYSVFDNVKGKPSGPYVVEFDTDEDPKTLRRFDVRPLGAQTPLYASATADIVEDRLEIRDFFALEPYDPKPIYKSLLGRLESFMARSGIHHVVIPPEEESLKAALESRGYVIKESGTFSDGETPGLILLRPVNFDPDETIDGIATFSELDAPASELPWDDLYRLNQNADISMSREDVENLLRDRTAHWCWTLSQKSGKKPRRHLGFFSIALTGERWELDQWVVDSRFKGKAEAEKELGFRINAILRKEGESTLLVPRALKSAITNLVPTMYIRKLNEDELLQADGRDMVALELPDLKRKPRPRSPGRARLMTPDESISNRDLRDLMRLDRQTSESPYTAKDWRELVAEKRIIWQLTTPTRFSFSSIVATHLADVFRIDRLAIDPRFDKQKTYRFYAGKLASLAAEGKVRTLILDESLLELAATIRSVAEDAGTSLTIKFRR